MRIIAIGTLKAFWQQPGHRDSERPIRSWYAAARGADWDSPQAVKRQFGSASIIGDNRVVFNLGGNKYRLVVKFNYPYRLGYVRFIGSHADYGAIDAETI